MIGMWTRIEFYQIHGQDSRSTRRWKKPQRSICGPERDWHEFKQIPDLRMCGLEVWTKIGKAAQKREKQELANEKPKLDNARRFRGIHFIDSYDGEVFRNPQYCEEKVGTSNGCDNAVQERYNEALTFSRLWSEETWIQKKIRNTKHPCAVEAHESTRQRTESCPPKAKDRTRWQSTICFTSLFHYRKRWKCRKRKQQWTKSGKSSIWCQHGNWKR